jgi:hypothetical protein
MFTVVLILAFAGAILAATVLSLRPVADHRLTILLLVGYAVRLAISPLTRDLNVFSSMSGDYAIYEYNGEMIAKLWHYAGVHFATNIANEEITVPLPSNLFAAVIYLNGEPTHLGCTAIVSAAASFACLEMYLLALLLGAGRNVALWTCAVTSGMPSFLFYTSNAFKDGFVALFVIGIFGCAVRLSRRFSVWQLALAGVFLACLWFTRFYLVFIVPPPLLLGLLGFRARSIFRTVLASLVIVASVSALYAYSSTPNVVVGHATKTFDLATSEDVLSANAMGGSGVTFDTTSPTGAFVLKFIYTLFSPFPWQPGSLGLQIGKIEALLWYYFVYRALRAAQVMWRERRSDLLMFGSLLIPLTVAYALSFSNIGLIVRQRLVIVLPTMLLAALSWSLQAERATHQHRLASPARAT